MNIKAIQLLTLTLLASCSLPLNAAEKKLEIVASFLPIYAHTQTVAGDLAKVSMLLSKDSSPHDYALNPSDIKRLARADLFIINGLGLEEWSNEIVKKAGNKKLVVVDSSKGISLLDSPKVVSLPSAEKIDHTGHDHGEGKNPHIWLDPISAQQQVKNIAEALIKADPKNADGYKKNRDAYLVELKKLHEDFRSKLNQLPIKNLITFHDAFPYLAKRYGMNYIGFIEEFPEKDPKPSELAALVKAIKDNKVKVLFAETGYSPKLLQSIATQTGAAVADIDTLEVGAPTADAYIKLMRKNLASFEKAWK
ncbi:MAG: metal ABC transporter substrate-binding protein [Blastochloris sp.]|nr:metal ABC transporter substrate-binding protein [Blastochloris sp.]